MSMRLFDMRREREHALNKAESIVAAADNAGRQMTEAETRDYDMALTAVNALNARIRPLEAQSSIRKVFPGGQIVPGAALDGGSSYAGTSHHDHKALGMRLSDDYANDFFEYVASSGQKIGAALYEGSNSAGGYAVPITVDGQIVPLAPQEMGVRSIAMVIPTAMDIKVPRKGAFGVAAGKAESTTSAPATFVEGSPTLEQFTLSAFMAGIKETISFELAQDVPSFQSFVVEDLLLAVQMFEESKYISGSGAGEAQGLIGNVGAGVTAAPDASGNLVSIDGTLDLVGSLNAVYHPNASWLMSRATSIIIRKAQRQANLFEPVWTRSGSQDFLHGYPVTYSAYMPTAAHGACPALFGDFRQGYVIGDRGGAGIYLKVLDQPLAAQGQIVLLAYRRTDGRVRRSEAIQAYNVAA